MAQHGLGRSLSELPRELRLIIVKYIGQTSMKIVRHTLLGQSICADDFIDDLEIYRFGLEFFLFCQKIIGIGHLKQEDLEKISDDVFRASCIGTKLENDEPGANVAETIGNIDFRIYIWISYRTRLNRIMDNDDDEKNAEMAAWEYRQINPWESKKHENAAMDGNLESLKWLHENCCRGGYDEWISPGCSCEQLLTGQSLECLEYAHDRIVNTKRIIKMIVENGSLDCLAYMHKRGHEFSNDLCVRAIKCGQLDCLKWLCGIGCIPDEDAYRTASIVGRMEYMRWLCNNIEQLDPREMCVMAIEHGSLECLEYSYECGYKELDDELCEIALLNGHIECLKWLCDKGCSLNKHTACNMAVMNDAVECLRFVRENGCHWDESTFKLAVKKNSVKCLQYLYKNGCPWDEYILDIAIRKRSVQCSEYLYRLGFKYDSDKPSST